MVIVAQCQGCQKQYTVAFDSGTHCRFAVKAPGLALAYDGTYELKERRISLIMSGPQFGASAPAEQRLSYGYVKELTDTTLVLGTDDDDETYTRIYTPKH